MSPLPTFARGSASLVFALLCVVLSLSARDASARSLLVLPVTANSEAADMLPAIDRLFHDALESRHGGVASAPDAAPCAERACALNTAKTAGLSGRDEVVYAGLEKLGAKWIFFATIVRADGGKAFNQRMTMTSLEDMEAVTQRMAESLVSRTAPEFAATVDDITERERTHERTRRKSPYAMGFGVGYLFPQAGGFNYLQEDANNPQSNYTETDFAQLLRVSWIHVWEFRRDLHLSVEANWAVPHAFGGDLNLAYVMGSGDFSPFVGGGTGLHYVRADEDPARSNRSASGPAVNAQAGFLLFRTYGLNLRVRGQYLAVFNADRDRGLVFDVAVLFQ